MSSIVKAVFDKAITLAPGAKIPIQFSSESQRESFRVRFYNEKKKYAAAVGEMEADTLVCRKASEKGLIFLIVEKTEPMSQPVIVNADGSFEVINCDLASAEERVVAAMVPKTDCTIYDLGHGQETPEQRRLRLMAEEEELNAPDQS